MDKHISIKDIKKKFKITSQSMYQIKPSKNKIIINKIGNVNINGTLINEFKLDEYNYDCKLVSILLSESDLKFVEQKNFYPIIKIAIYGKNILICNLYYAFLPDNSKAFSLNKEIIGKFVIVLEKGKNMIMIKIIGEYTDPKCMMSQLVESCYSEPVLKHF
jgi:hypothetical protein